MGLVRHSSASLFTKHTNRSVYNLDLSDKMRRFFLPKPAPPRDANESSDNAFSVPSSSSPKRNIVPNNESSTDADNTCKSPPHSFVPPPPSMRDEGRQWTSVIPDYDSILLDEDIAAAKDPSERLLNWTIHNGMMCRFRTPTTAKYSRVIAFDLDHTIIVPKSNGRFAQSSDDWKFWHSEVPRTISSLFAEGYGIVFLSNQQGLGGSQKHKVSEFQRKVDAVIDALGVPVDFLCAIDDNRFRKPLTGMWEFYRCARGDDGMSAAFVGDAAGRPQHGTRAKDFSDSDLKFARNMGMPFYTPEKLFLHSSQRIHSEFPAELSEPRLIDQLRKFRKRSYNDMSGVLDSTSDNVSDEQLVPPSFAGNQELLLLVAAPASGKSRIALILERDHSYARVNRDELGSMDACLSAARAALREGRSVVVDNVNMNKASRKPWASLVKEIGSPLLFRALVLDVAKDVCLQLNKYRAADPQTRKPDQRSVPTMVIHSFFKNKEMPGANEGFHRIDTISWTPVEPSHGTGQRLMRMYL